MKDVEKLRLTNATDFVGEIVRLGFHEAGTFTPPNISGPDGCVLVDDAPNISLKPLIKQLDQLRDKKYSTISRSDFWLFVASHATDLAAKASGSLKFLRLTNKFRWGRKDRTSCESDKGKLPSPLLNIDGVINVFQTRMGFTIPETVALIGGHTVGRFSNRFNLDTTPSTFDNRIFKDLLNLQWKRDSSLGFPLWRSSKNTILFHTDLSLAYKVGEVNDTCQVNVESNPCSTIANIHETRKWIEKFAKNQCHFFQIYARAWKKMLEFGYSKTELKHISVFC